MTGSIVCGGAALAAVACALALLTHLKRVLDEEDRQVEKIWH